MFKDTSDKVIGNGCIFYNTIGNIDSVIIKLVCSLIDIEYDTYSSIKIYRGGSLYYGTELVLSFDNKLFVDVRLNINNKDISIYEGINSFVSIFNNTLNLNINDYKYIMLNMGDKFDNIMYDEFVIDSNFTDYFSDKFKMIFYDYKMIYDIFIGGNLYVSDKVRWVSLLWVQDYNELNIIIGNFFLHRYEKRVLLYLLNYYWNK